MKGLFWNILGLGIVYLFTQIVNWSLWLSIPVGILAAAVVVLIASYLVAKLKGRILYGD
jgi:ABC-type branched-subunit amino acid transport system permease subunit